MADNDLFPTQGQGKPAEGEQQTQGQQQAQGVSQEQIHQAMADAVTPLQTQIAEQQQQLTQQNQVIQQMIERTPQAPQQQGTDQGVEEDYQKLLNNPASFVDDRIDERALAVLRDKAGPALRTVFEQERERNFATEKTAVDQQYGDGFYEEHVQPLVEQAVKQYESYPEAMAHKNWAHTVVWGSMGLNLKDPEKYEAMTTKRAEAEKARSAPPQVLTDSRSRPSNSKTLTPEEKDFIERLDSRSGIKVDPKQYLEDRNRGTSLSDWKETTKPAEASK